MGPAAAGIVSTAIGGMMGFLGGERANKINQREAQKNRDFQERMRNTSWQAAVEDMRQAGINPALAYSQGGAASPGGATAAPAENTSASALQAAQARKSLNLLDAQIAKTVQEGRSAEAAAEIDQTRKNFLTTTFEANGYRSAPRINELLELELLEKAAGVSNVQALARRNSELARIAGPMADLSDRMGEWLPGLGLIGGGLGAVGNLIRGLRSPAKILKRKK